MVMLLSCHHVCRVRPRRRPRQLAGLLIASVSITVSALSSQCPRIAVIGGGASGVFSAIQAADELKLMGRGSSRNPPQVVVLEATSKTLQKVKISGGGRCNVLHDTSKSTSTILAGYPRGQKELNGLFHKHFTPSMAASWFEDRGVTLKVEDDGRVFPSTDSSDTIIETLLSAAKNAGVDIRLRSKVSSISMADADKSSQTQDPNKIFNIHFKDDSIESFEAIILATGSSPTGYYLAETCLQHDLVKPVPSLFTLNCKLAVNEGGLLHDLAGISVPSASVKLTKKLVQDGPLLITHHGISGPAVLRLSAFAAREFNELQYRNTTVTINWDTTAFQRQPEQVLEKQLWPITASNPKRTVSSACPIPGNSIPRRLWSSLVAQSGIPDDAVWGAISKKLVRKLAQNIVSCPIEITSKGTFKEEFVTAGGLSLKQINMKTMESKRCPGLYFCGELINVDGITGGYNFMNCWSTGFTAGTSSAHYISSLSTSTNPTSETSQKTAMS